MCVDFVAGSYIEYGSVSSPSWYDVHTRNLTCFNSEQTQFVGRDTAGWFVYTVT